MPDRIDIEEGSGMKRTLVVSCLVLVAAAAIGIAGAANPAQKGKLMNPAALKEKAPEVFGVRLDTSQGPVVIEVTRAWAPNGADRFYNLVKAGFYDDVRFFRVLSGFMAQLGINGDPSVSAVWRGATIADDPVKASNTRGMVTFATAGPNTRTTQIFINYGDNSRLDADGFSPFGKVIEGMDVVEKLYAGYGEGTPRGQGPDQGKLQREGNAYLQSGFPKLDYIKKATIVKGEAKKAEKPATPPPPAAKP
jgi:peptidyl-prolyl cis-trans isomerase A (cyclophilin A)